MMGEQTDCIVQTTGMKEEEREEFLGEFEKERKHSLVGFCVMGGIFGEGIDLKEELLIGAIVVGTGLPPVSYTHLDVYKRQCPYRKPTQVDEERILRPAEEALLRNSAK